MKLNMSSIMVLIIISFSSIATIFMLLRPDEENKLEKMKMFLESQHIPEIGLLRASIWTVPDNHSIWVSSDNLLASRALKVADSPLAEEIIMILERDYGGGFNGLHEVLLGRRIKLPPRTEVENRLGEVSVRGVTYIVKFEDRSSGDYMTDWIRYVDLSVYVALEKIMEDELEEAKMIFQDLIDTWDGYGFRDQAYNKTYQAYKIALVHYLYRVLREADPSFIKRFTDKVEEMSKIGWMMMDLSGGIIAEYRVENGELVWVGDPNTETTSMFMLSYYSDYPVKVANVYLRRKGEKLLFETFVLILSIAITVVLVFSITPYLKRKLFI